MFAENVPMTESKAVLSVLRSVVNISTGIVGSQTCQNSSLLTSRLRGFEFIMIIEVRSFKQWHKFNQYFENYCVKTPPSAVYNLL